MSSKRFGVGSCVRLLKMRAKRRPQPLPSAGRHNLLSGLARRVKTQQRANEKADTDLWQSGQCRQISHTNDCLIQAQQALPRSKAMMACSRRLEDAPFFGSVLVKPEASCCASADQRAKGCTLLAFGNAANHCTGSRASANDRRCAPWPRHPAMTVLVIDKALTIEAGDPAIADFV